MKRYSYTWVGATLSLVLFSSAALAASIGDRVWHDIYSWGFQDPSESGIEGVFVSLEDCQGRGMAAAITGPNGRYMFDGLEAGKYKIHFHLPRGYYFTLQGVGPGAKDSDADRTTGRTKCINLADGQTKKNIDAGLLTVESSPEPEETPLQITEVMVQDELDKIVIFGTGFNADGPLQVTLGQPGFPGDITANCTLDADPTMITCDFPGGLPDPGDYLLIVQTGPDTEEPFDDYDEYDLTIGAVGPTGPEGPQGPTGPPGELVLAGQQCEPGQFVSGFDGSGNIICDEQSGGCFHPRQFFNTNNPGGYLVACVERAGCPDPFEVSCQVEESSEAECINGSSAPECNSAAQTLRDEGCQNVCADEAF